MKSSTPLMQPTARKRIWPSVAQWFDTNAADARQFDDAIDWLRVIPFIAMHVMCIGVIWVGVSPIALIVAAVLYVLRMFAITAFYHRYFSHKAFKTSRTVQLLFALIGASCVQRGPLWWASHHRNHHRNADTEHDLHSPSQHGFWRSHVGWFLTKRGFHTDRLVIADLNRFAELRWIDRFDVVVPIVFATGLFFLGRWLEHAYPPLHTSGAQMLIWGFFVSTVVLLHATVTINSLAHRFGSRRYDTHDDSRNNWLLALITFGEGWHNNHHFFPGSARQGFRWWEIDMTYYALRG
ncbi:MAG: acyl-CoA desaturase, partial [Rudaea sp.]